MRKACPFLVLVFILANCFMADAKILRVGYNGLALEGVDFNDITSANNAANTGDTIQIYGAQGGNISKRLVVMGFGYNFDVHTNLQAIGTDAPSQAGYPGFNILPGAEGSIIEGLHFVSWPLNIQTSNITIKRCIGGIQLYNNSSSINDIKIISSVITRAGMMYSTGFSCSNFQMFNCLVQGQISFYGSGSNGALINCVIGTQYNGGGQTNLTNAGFLIKNSVVVSMTGNEVNTVWENNFFAQAQPSTLPQGSNNRWGQQYSALFERLGGNNDEPGWHAYTSFDEAYFKLKSGSPAINGGFDGAGTPTDCGIFGGEPAYYYRLSGVPAAPAIYKITPASGAATTNPYNVTISVRSNN